MGWLRGLLGAASSGFGPWLLLGAFLVGMGAGVWVTAAIKRGDVAQAQKETADCLRDRSTEALKSTNLALRGLEESVAVVRDLAMASALKEAERVKRQEKLLKGLRNVPKTDACSRSPAFQLYLGSLRD